jgi:hypothetical protein
VSCIWLLPCNYGGGLKHMVEKLTNVYITQVIIIKQLLRYVYAYKQWICVGNINFCLPSTDLFLNWCKFCDKSLSVTCGRSLFLFLWVLYRCISHTHTQLTAIQFYKHPDSYFLTITFEYNGIDTPLNTKKKNIFH